MAVLKTENLMLEVKFNKLKEPVIFKSYYTAMTVYISVSCYDYAGKTQFACNEEECIGFVKRLSEIYSSLKEGVTAISDYEPDENYLCIKSDGLGHFYISGVFNNWGKWTLKFEECIDQTYFKNFVKQLGEEFK